MVQPCHGGTHKCFPGQTTTQGTVASRAIRRHGSAKKKTQQREQQRQKERQQDPRLQKLNDAKDMNMNSKEVVAKYRAAGVAVVCTIVKQSQSNNAVHVEKSYGI